MSSQDKLKLFYFWCLMALVFLVNLLCVLLLDGCSTQPVVMTPKPPAVPSVATNAQVDVAAKPLEVVVLPPAPAPRLVVKYHWDANPFAYGFYAVGPTPFGPWTIVTNFPTPDGGGSVCFTNPCTNAAGFINAGSAPINANPPSGADLNTL